MQKTIFRPLILKSETCEWLNIFLLLEVSQVIWLASGHVLASETVTGCECYELLLICQAAAGVMLPIAAGLLSGNYLPRLPAGHWLCDLGDEWLRWYPARLPPP